MDDLRYISNSFRCHVQAINPNVKVEYLRTFPIYEDLFAVVELQHDISQLAAMFLEYQLRSKGNHGTSNVLKDEHIKLAHSFTFCVGSSSLSNIHCEC